MKEISEEEEKDGQNRILPPSPPSFPSNFLHPYLSTFPGVGRAREEGGKHKTQKLEGCIFIIIFSLFTNL
jgi:hypothetical protein